MTEKDLKLYIHTIIGFFALSVGYPYGGTMFILVMIPYLLYMVFKMNAIYLPALILHCASETSANHIVFIAIIVLSIWKYRQLLSLKLGVLFWILIGLIPIFVWLVWQRISKVGDYPPVGFTYISYYLSFFAFFYGVLIGNTFTKKILMVIYSILFIVFILYITGTLGFTRIVVAFTYLYIASIPLIFHIGKKNYLLLGIALFAFTSLFIGVEESTFTTLFVSLFSLLLVFLYFKQKRKLILRLTGIIPFIIIFVLYVYGINNYMGVVPDSVPEGIDIFSWTNLTNRFSFKFFGDRAPFWAGGFTQIITYQNLFPIPDQPDILAVFQSGQEAEITFGAHTTFIELVRKYGIIAGALLGFCLIYMTVISRKVFLIKNLNNYLVPFFAMAFACTIILSLTGQYEMMPGYALMTFGIMGIAYSFSRNNLKSN
jgi:hypothetical protein